MDQRLWNKDNIFIRNIIVATLAELYKLVYFFNHDGANNIKKVDVPFKLGIGSETFVLEEYFNNLDDDSNEVCFAMGNYEQVPRGVLKVSSIDLDLSSQTNKFNRIDIVRDVNKHLWTYNVDAAFVPINISFDCTIICTNITEMLKINERIFSLFAVRADYFEINHGGFRCQAALNFPESIGHNVPMDYSFDTKKEFTLSCNIDVKSMLPVFKYGIGLTEMDMLVSKLNVSDDPEDPQISAPLIAEFGRDKTGQLCAFKAGIMTSITTNLYESGEFIESRTVTGD